MDDLIQINWKRAFDELMPYINGKGGVIGITGGVASALDIFIDIFEHKILSQKDNNIFLRINPTAEETRYQGGIIAKLEDKLGIVVEERPRPISVNAVVNFGNEVDAQEVAINNNTVNNLVEINEASQQPAGALRRRAKNVISGLKERLKTNRIVLILYNWHGELSDDPDEIMPTQTARWFGGELWREYCLKDLAHDGLLVVCAQIVRDNHTRHNLTPRPTYSLTLPSRYDRDEREAAKQDIANAFVSQCGESAESSVIRADGLLIDCEDEPASVYARTGTQIGVLIMRRIV